MLSQTQTLYGFRNLLIGGDFATNPWGRGTGLGLTAANGYGPDRWLCSAGAATSAVFTRQTPITGKTMLYLQRTASTGGTGTIQAIQTLEVLNAQSLAGTTIGISFDALAGSNFSAAGGIMLLSVYFGTGTSDVSPLTGFTGQTIFGQNFTPAVTVTRYSATFAVPAGTTQVALGFSFAGIGTAGANDGVEIGDIQLQRGAIISPMERRPVGIESLLCGRYYYASPTTGTGGVLVYSGSVTTTGAYIANQSFPAIMRVAPTVTGANINAAGFAGTTGTLTASVAGILETRTAISTSLGGFFLSKFTADAEIY